MIGELLPAAVMVEVAYDDPPEARLEPAEEPAVARAVDGRRREYTTVRHCARLALARLGVPYRPLVPGLRGAPGWPDGVVGSLTHCAGFRGAAVARAGDVVSLGIDAEPAEALPEGVLDTIALPGEQKRNAELLAEHPEIPWDRLLFSAKESVYKTWFPLTGVFLDFDGADITLDPNGTFHAELQVPGPVVDGRRLQSFTGRWIVHGGHLATAITVLP
ncbi:4'-phosphopantetheinyl transferase superfamily protein [Kitasatospora sp. A2-31]|uniref:4'-phosphopantetheinyl transferase family protein n=1 Tax=Kitasatospora sp. A2-31 TaxID=2916414 RepID=UPI001EE9B15E|nr:4'-phosphopantetheinyl transferase superfamily protein [Kitasatospora sp. A2-31]MCG6495474.1 4'-phosphopantetheinyl transferase superfamily protein [Kitasatospora sp. A2-31]